MTETSPEFSEKALTQEPVKAPVSKSAGKFVKYVGTATRRIITSEHWEREGASDMPTTEWTFNNEYKIPVSDFSEVALSYLKRDGRFKITE